jgi:ribosome-interacting GTPase 1
MQDLIRGADAAALVVDLGADEGIEQFRQVLDKLNRTRTRLADRTFLDDTDVGLSFTRTLLVPNKLDAAGAADRLAFLHEWHSPAFPEYAVSAVAGTGLPALREAIFNALGVIRIYTKLPAEKEPDRSHPLTLCSGGTVLELAELIHEELAAKLKFARVWSYGAQEIAHVKGDHTLQDLDVVELHI